MHRTRRICSNTFVLFLEIIEGSGGSASCGTQLNCRTPFAITTALLSSPLFHLLVGCSSTFQNGNVHCAKLTSRFRSKELTFGKMKRLIEFLRLASASGVSVSRHFYLVFLKIVAQKVRLSVSVLHDRYTLMLETTLVSFRTLPFFLPLVTNTFSSTPLNPLRFLATTPVLIFSSMASKFGNRRF